MLLLVIAVTQRCSFHSQRWTAVTWELLPKSRFGQFRIPAELDGRLVRRVGAMVILLYRWTTETGGI